MTIDVYQEVTDTIIHALETQATVPWRHPILGHTSASGGGCPKNLNTGKDYRGVNIFTLAVTAWTQGFASAYWLTFKQAKDRGAHVRKGSKSTPVVFWKQTVTHDRQTGEEKVIPVLKFYRVFNAEQCEGLAYPDQVPMPPAGDFVPIEAAEQIVSGYEDGPKVEHVGSRACYLPQADTVQIAVPDRFESREAYYATLFHELAHSTGHSRRLDRGLDTQLAPFGSPDYSKEELVAEMGAAFLCAVTGIAPATLENSTAYIQGWLSKLRGDKKLVVTAAGAAQRSADWIQGHHQAER
jgi:antirestriction protein ArdC